MTKPKLSIVIPCLNEERYLPKLLSDLTKQNQSIAFEVIVADSASTDQTVELAKTFETSLSLKITTLNQRGAARARNAGAASAEGDYLLFLDADARVPKDFIEQLWSEHSTHDADMMTCDFKATGFHPFDIIYYWGISRFFKNSFASSSPLMSGCVQFVSAKLHKQSNGYDESASVGEDIDYAQRIAELATKPHYVSSTHVKVSSRRFKTDGRITMLLRQYQWVSGRDLEYVPVNSFEFGHYRSGEKKLTLLDLLEQPKLAREVVQAAYYLIREGLQ